MIAPFIQDIRYAARRLFQSPAFTLTVLVMLTLGIGANAAIFSLVNAILLRPLAYAEPERLVTINHLYPSLGGLEASVSVPGFRDYSAQKHVFSSVAAQAPWSANLTGVGEPMRIDGSRVTGRYFSTLGARAALGRTIREDEAQAGREHVVVLSDGFWRRQFGADPATVGRMLNINGEAYEVVGVMPPTFRDYWSSRIDIWTPLVFPPESFADRNRTNEWLALTCRLADGVTSDRAQTEMTALATRLVKEYPTNYPPNWTLLVTPLHERAVREARPALLVLLGAVGFVLLIACANVANLLLARGASQTREIAIRTALGAGRGRLIGQLLTESLMLATIGGLFGLLLAWIAVRFIAGLEAADLPRAAEIAMDGRVVLFAAAVAIVTSLIFGLVPALRVSRADLHETLKESGGRGTTDAGHLLRGVLVVGELALALTLLVGAGLLIRSFGHLLAVSPGFDPENLLTMNVSLSRAKYAEEAQQTQFFETALEKVKAVPGVRGAAASSNLPFSESWWTGSYLVEGYEAPPGQPAPWGDMRIITADYFTVMRVPLLKGRMFTAADRQGSQPVVIVDDETVRRFWPNEDPIGKRIGSRSRNNPNWRVVVGVVGHTKHEGLDAEARTQTYFPHGQLPIPNMFIAVRAAGEPEQLTGAVRAAIRAVDPDQPIARVSTMETLIETSVGQRRLAMTLLGLFAGLALLLASIGIYGLISYSVTQRTRELGIRVALGARASTLLRMVMGQGLRLTVAGLVLGLVGAFSLTRFIETQLFGVEPTDPATFVLVPTLLLGVALAATWIPAFRATRVDPVVALREE